MKDFLIVSDGTDDQHGFDCVEALAREFDGHVNVVVTTELPPFPMAVGDGVVYVPGYEKLSEEALARGGKLRSAAEQRFAQHTFPVTVFHVDEALEALGSAVATIARTHDLTVTTLPAAEDESRLRTAIFDKVLIEGGRALLGLPAGTTCNGTFGRVALAWNHSRECSRALSQAMPFLKKAQAVTVILVDPTLRRAGEDHRPGDDVISHLDRHGIPATLARVSSGDSQVSEAIIAETVGIGSDLLVMGAQAEGGLLRWLQSSTSREVFAATPIPLLVAH